ncbi:phosphofructokinase [Planctomycetales bacterium]|nr:phosphofructokinase [Planctomycetales bacterium]
MFIITVTLNPALDQTVTLEKLTVGAVHRASSVEQHAGGKGVNVSSCLADWGVPTLAAGFLGRNNAAIFENFLLKKGIKDRFFRLNGDTRTNIKIVDATGTTDLNLPGVKLADDDGQKLERMLLDGVFAATTGTAILAGSLPPNCPTDIYRKLLTGLKKRGCRVFLDADGAALQAALAGDVLPDCIKPNEREFAEWAGGEALSRAEMIAAADRLRGRGLGLVVISLGADGALFIGDEIIHAAGTLDRITSTVGAGDAMMAGIAAAENEGGNLERVARLGTAFSLAKLGLSGANLPEKAAVENIARQVRIEKIKRG